jgi:hypothetical protein
MADDRRVDQQVDRLCGQRAERRQPQTPDLTVVGRPAQAGSAQEGASSGGAQQALELGLVDHGPPELTRLVEL